MKKPLEMGLCNAISVGSTPIIRSKAKGPSQDGPFALERLFEKEVR